MDNKDNFKRAKDLLLGAVETVIEIAQQTASSSSSSPNPRPSTPLSLSGQPSTSTSKPKSFLSLGSNARSRSTDKQVPLHCSDSVISEHKRVFGYKPSKAYSKARCNKGRSAPGQFRGKAKAPGKSIWKRDCICLSESDQTWKPSPEEKMKLGLGLKEISFIVDGDEDHVHDATFPVLAKCGGYTLLRLGGGSKSLVEIEGPESGITVPYLRDILNQAKLYVRPLQCDISEEDVKEFLDPSVSSVTDTMVHVHAHVFL